MDRAFVDHETGDTTCVWEAPSREDVEKLFSDAGVDYESMTEVEEMHLPG